MERTQGQRYTELFKIQCLTLDTKDNTDILVQTANYCHVTVKQCQFFIITPRSSLKTTIVYFYHMPTQYHPQLKQRVKQCQIWISLQFTLTPRTPHYYRHLATANKSQPLGKSMKKRNEFPLKRTLPFTEMQTLSSPPARSFTCFFSLALTDT